MFNFSTVIVYRCLRKDSQLNQMSQLFINRKNHVCFYFDFLDDFSAAVSNF